jgi:hypothetical protein
MRKLNDSEVLKLIRIADGNIKEWRSHWFTLGIPIPHYSKLEDQLEAISKLGDSQNSSCGDCGGTNYPNVKGELAYHLSSSWFGTYGYTGYPKDQNCAAAEILQNSISKLENSLS